MFVLYLRAVQNLNKKWPLVLLLLCLLFLIVNKVLLKKIHKTYPGFGIDLPMSYTTHGIDVSKYQKKIEKEQNQLQKMQSPWRRMHWLVRHGPAER